MKAYFSAVKSLFRQIKGDLMLLACCFAPVLAGVFFKFVVPIFERLLTSYFHKEALLSPYYLLFDLLLLLLAPTMAGFVCAMIVLEEQDNKLLNYYAVSPLGIRGYFISKLFIPVFIFTLLLLPVLLLFHLSSEYLALLVPMLLYSLFNGILTCLLIISIAGNKVEGMAMGKLSGLILLGIFISFFVKSNVKYLGSILPLFWLSNGIVAARPVDFLIGLLINIFWIFLLFRHFVQKISWN